MPKYSWLSVLAVQLPRGVYSSENAPVLIWTLLLSILFWVLFTVLNFHLMMNQFSPQCSLHWHWQHCELAPVVKEHVYWYNDVENHSSFANIITLAVVGQHPTSWSSRNFNWNMSGNCLGAARCLQFSCLCWKKTKKNCVRARVFAFLSHIRFWKGIW